MTRWLLALVGLASLTPGLVRAERAVVLPLRSEVEMTAQQIAVLRAAHEQTLRDQGIEPVAQVGDESCADHACVAVRIEQAVAQHAVELAIWRSDSGGISGVSVSVLTRSGERFSEGTQLASDGDVAAAIARATQGAYARMRRGPGPWLELSGTPEGASILVDDTVAGILPQRVKVPGGLHRVRVSRDGYETFETTVTVPRNIDALKQLAVELQPVRPTSVASSANANGSKSRTWNYVLAGIGVAASAALAIGPIRSATQDGECGRVQNGACTGVVDFDGGQGIQLAASMLLLGAGVTVALWSPL